MFSDHFDVVFANKKRFNITPVVVVVVVLVIVAISDTKQSFERVLVAQTHK